MNSEMNFRTRVYIVLVAVFVGCLVISTVVARKPINFLGLTANFGVIVYVFTFIITDIVAEIWGKAHARFMLISGFISLLITFFFTTLAVIWPAPEFWTDQPAYDIVLANTFQVMVAGILAYLAAQFYDVWAFSLLKKKYQQKHLWLRTNVSTIPAQFIDTIIFVPIAFAGTQFVGQIFIGILTFKIVVALLEQFIVYAVVWGLRSRRFNWSSSFTSEVAS